MSNRLKKNIIFVYFLLIYIYILFGYLVDYNYFLIIIAVSNIYIYIKLCNGLYFHIILKILLFNFFMVGFVLFERISMTIFLCGMDGIGFLHRNGILNYNYACSGFTFYEDLLFNFLSSLYYPIYIYIFIKPFVNHLDKSIRKIQIEEK